MFGVLLEPCEQRGRDRDQALVAALRLAHTQQAGSTLTNQVVGAQTQRLVQAQTAIGQPWTRVVVSMCTTPGADAR